MNCLVLLLPLVDEALALLHDNPRSFLKSEVFEDLRDLWDGQRVDLESLADFEHLPDAAPEGSFFLGVFGGWADDVDDDLKLEIPSICVESLAN